MDNVRIARKLVRLAKALVGESFPKQDLTMRALQKRGYKYVNDFGTGDEFTVVMWRRKKGWIIDSVQIEKNGTVFGEPLQEFLKHDVR